MRYVLIAIGAAGVLLAIAPLVIAVIPFLVGIAGAVFCFFGVAWIIKRCIDIANHDIWRM